MKRFLSLSCLALGVTVSSFAGSFTGSGAYVADANVAGLSAQLLDFTTGISAVPVTAFSTLPFTIPSGLSGTISTVAGSGSGQAGSLTNSSFTNSFGGANNQYIMSYTGGAAANTNSASSLTIAINSSNANAFAIDYSYANVVNSVTVTTSTGSATFSLPINSNQAGGGNGVGYVGFVTDSTTTGTINSITFNFALGEQSNPAVRDILAFDNLRLYTGATTPTSSSSSSSAPPSNVVPEPSTYALLGAGLSAIALFRRRR